MKDISVILPSYKPDEKLYKTVCELKSAGFDDIIVVDDGGGAEYASYFDEVRALPECTVLVHPENRGKGAALKTAYKWYTENRNGVGVITVDGDGQHFPEDVKACCERLCETDECVLGVRDFSLPDVPPRSRFGNNVTSGIFRIFVGMRCSDTQTGLRAFPARLLPLMISVSGDRYEYETNVLLSMKREGIPFHEVKITTVYIDENETSHFRPVRDSARIYMLIIKFLLTSTFIKFLGSSFLSYLVDISLFSLLSFLLSGLRGNLLTVAVPYALARLASSFLNYTLNRRVFKSGSAIGKTIAKYYLLAIFILAAGAILVSLAVWGLLYIPAVANTVVTPAEKTVLYDLVKIPVDCALYVVSYRVQKKYIFITQ